MWIWAAKDLIERHSLNEKWEWLYETGKRWFSDFYRPFFDPRDGLYRGQASFVDIHFTDGGTPLFHPFFPRDDFYHNNSSWPFVDTFLIKAMETADGVNRTALNAALLARTCVDDGTFHEVTDYRTRAVKGSGSQLWTAASFIDTCRRAGLIDETVQPAG